ncbi:MAG: tetratricopeptide repeat protein [Flavobacteriaceae bacterium]|jgi:tetratricopeptide (TPR) repeat protein|nr:tetratricopeptide repeat protein [Flavobacteriaceae bacterium]
MRKTILFLFILVVFGACSSQKKKQNNSTFLKGFHTYYNTLFNGEEALNTELEDRKKSYKENFYANYIPILKYDVVSDQPKTNNSGLFKGNEIGVPGGGDPGMQTQQSGTSTSMEIAGAKAEKAIRKYSVIKSGEEKNKRIFDSYILLTKSYLYQNKPLEALEAVNKIFPNFKKSKKLPLAKIYQGQSYAKLEDYYRSNEVFLALKQDKIKKKYKKLASVYYSEMLLKDGKKEEAAAELADAFKLNKNRELRSRIAFLRGQILSELGRNDEAHESFAAAYKYSIDYDFEVKSQIEIAKTFNAASDNYDEWKQKIEKISKKGTYVSRKNEFYYALGLMAKKAGKPDEADEYFRKSIVGDASDPQIRGRAFYEIGKAYFDASDYLYAGTYYDYALAVMTYEPEKARLAEQSANIKQITKNYYLIKNNDSILALAKMSEDEQIAYFTDYINKLKEKEAIAELEKKRAERSEGFDTGDYDANSIFAGNTGGFQDFSDPKNSGGGSFYFGNTNTISKGQTNFKQVWGNRALADNWRFSAQTSTLEDIKNEAMGQTTAPDPRRLDPAFYIEKIPTEESELAALKKARDTASLGLGRMYDAYFDDKPLATKTLYELIDEKPEPEEDVKLQALYLIFTMNYENNPAAGERAKQTILDEFPYTSYAEYVKNPRNKEFSQSSPEVLQIYADAFDLYQNEKYEDSQKTIDSALAQYPKDALVPKFELLNAFNTGKTAGKEVMILQLEQIALNYAKTPEGLKAIEMLKYLKSGLKIEMTDEQGNKIEEEKPTEPKPEGKVEPINPFAPPPIPKDSEIEVPNPRLNPTAPSSSPTKKGRNMPLPGKSRG